MDEAKVLISHRVPKELKFAFDLACEKTDQSSSQVIRKLMRAYVMEVGRNLLAQKIANSVIKDNDSAIEGAVRSGEL